MKSITMPKTEQLIEKTTNDQESVQVNETSASATVENPKTKFTAVDMWNRNRQSRSASDRMRKWNLN